MILRSSILQGIYRDSTLLDRHVGQPPCLFRAQNKTFLARHRTGHTADGFGIQSEQRYINAAYQATDVRTQRTLCFLAPLRSGRAEGVSKGGMTSILTIPKRHAPFGGLSWLLLWPRKEVTATLPSGTW